MNFHGCEIGQNSSRLAGFHQGSLLFLGGRLVFLLPLPASADASEALPADLPTARCLLLERVSREKTSLRMHRLLVTMIKVDH